MPNAGPPSDDHRSCLRLDGAEKLAYPSRAAAKRGCPRHEPVHRCRQCGAWHRATKQRTEASRETWPAAAWLATRRAA
jgi:hypothetical protein